MRILPFALTTVCCTTILAGCGNEHPNASTDSAALPAPSASVAPGVQTPDPNRTIIKVDMITDETGNYFKPKTFEARQGDVIRFVLEQGVHNVHFLPDSNPGKKGLPPVGDMLQLPGQTYDIKVSWDPGTYFFQCDPHAALGMTGHVTITQ